MYSIPCLNIKECELQSCILITLFVSLMIYRRNLHKFVTSAYISCTECSSFYSATTFFFFWIFTFSFTQNRNPNQSFKFFHFKTYIILILSFFIFIYCVSSDLEQQETSKSVCVKCRFILEVWASIFLIEK